MRRDTDTMKVPPSRPSTAENTVSVRRKALVLGVRGVAELIAQQLEAEGFSVEIHASETRPLPAPTDPDAERVLRQILGDFARAAGPSRGLPHCVHPAVSIWAERPELPVIAQDFGLAVICPPARVLNLFSNKLNMLGEAEKLGIPNLLAGGVPIHSHHEIEKQIKSQNLKFPFVLRSVKGGGSFRLHVIPDFETLEKKIPLWLEQLRRRLGEVMLFAERYLEGARHIVVPFARFVDGRAQTFPLMDASLQCRSRKIVEFCPADWVEASVEKQIRDWTLLFAQSIGFVGVGSLEFLVDSSRAYFVEGAARLGTEFHLWEKVAGTRAVSWQLAAMEGGRSTPEPTMTPEKEWAAGMSLRFYAEDSLLQLPQPGEVYEVGERRRWVFPGAIAELSLAVEAGQRISPYGHGMVGLLTVGAKNRKQALVVARGVLDEVWVAGSLQTNERFLSELLQHPWVREGMFHAGFVDEEFIPALRPPVDLMRTFASIFALNPAFQPEVKPVQTDSPPSNSQATAHVTRWAVGDQWVKPDSASVKWVSDPEFWKLDNGLTGISGYVQSPPDGKRLRLCGYPIDSDRWQVRLGNWVMIVRRVVTSSGVKHRARLSALVSGRVHAILFRKGAVVSAHEPLMVIESLNMLIPHALPGEVKITQWKVNAEDHVAAGDELAEFEVLTKN